MGAPPFTRENAAFYAMRGNQSPKRFLDAPPDIRQIRARMNEIERKMRTAANSKTLDELTRCYERLFKVWAHLANSPAPGQRRPGFERPQRVIDALPALPENVPDPEPVEDDAILPVVLPSELFED